MKLLTIVLFASAALAAIAQGEAGFPDETGFVTEIQEYKPEYAAKPQLRRFLEGSGTGTTPAPVTPAPVTPAPATPAPATPTPATPAPATTAPTTPSPTPAPQTPAPSTAAPSPTPTSTPATGSGSGATKTPAPATTAPVSTTTTTTTTPSTTTDTAIATVAPSSGKAENSSSSSVSGTQKSTKTPAPTTTSANSNTETDSKMSTGTIAGIVGGIIAGIVVLAFVTMALIRRKRDNDDDPLSPFELSMDKGYSGAQAYGGNAPGFAGNNAARGNAPVRTQELATDTPPAGAVAAGVAYSQFYDVTTSPGSINQPPRRNSSGHHDEPVADNGANLWMSAMDVKENDSYLSAKESHDGDSLNSGRNSYDVGYTDDQSSQISGSSDLNSAKDFPDYEDESARGSYEL